MRPTGTRNDDQACTSAHPYLIASVCFGEIADPFYAVIIALLKDFEESNKDTRCREHEHLKINVDWRASPCLPVRRGRQLCRA